MSGEKQGWTDPLNIGGDRGTWWDPAGVFQEGGIFGGDKPNPADEAKTQLILRMLSREKALYPQVSDFLKNLPAAADTAYNAETGGINELYPGVMKQISDYSLPPEADTFLSNLRNEQVNSISSDINDLIGSKIADYARRGVTSSSTAEGMGKEVGKAVLPAISQANQNYWNAKLTLPGQNAMQRYGLAATHGTALGEAERNKLNTLYSPLSSVWGATVGAGNMQTPATPDKFAGMGRLTSMIGDIMPLFGG